MVPKISTGREIFLIKFNSHHCFLNAILVNKLLKVMKNNYIPTTFDMYNQGNYYNRFLYRNSGAGK